MHGYTILEAEHGSDALSICRRHQDSIDLLITDMVMPQMSGGELVRRLTLLRPSIQVLYISGYTEEAISDQVKSDRMHFLQKPFTIEALASKVRKILDAKDT